MVTFSGIEPGTSNMSIRYLIPYAKVPVSLAEVPTNVSRDDDDDDDGRAVVLEGFLPAS